MLRRITNFFRLLFCCTKLETPLLQPEVYKRKPIPKKLRNQVWLKYHGDTDMGKCYCCDITVTRFDAGWHCSHVRSENKGGETMLENLRCCCRHCNLSMGTQNLYAYIIEKQLIGLGFQNAKAYLDAHPSELHDKRTNNWRKSGGNSNVKKKRDTKKARNSKQIEIYVS